MNRRSFYQSLLGFGASLPIIGATLAKKKGTTMPTFRGIEPFIGEVAMFAGNFAPRGWAFCDGQLLQISQNQALFSLLGTMYGGDGRVTFALPDLRGRVPLHAGGSAGPGLSQRRVGDRGGTESVALTAAEMPAHNHYMQVFPGDGTSSNPAGCVPAMSPLPEYRPPGVSTGHNMAPDALSQTGGDRAHQNMQPFLGLNYIIALVGIYPSRN